jgi:hypothetical protein
MTYARSVLPSASGSTPLISKQAPKSIIPAVTSSVSLVSKATIFARNISPAAATSSAALSNLMTYVRNVSLSTTTQVSQAKQVPKVSALSSGSAVSLARGVGLNLMVLSMGTQRRIGGLIPSEEQDPDEDVAPSEGTYLPAASLFKGVGKPFSLSSSGTSDLQRVLIANRILSSSSASTLLLAKQALKTILHSTTSTAELSRVFSANRLISPAASTSVATLLQGLVYARDLFTPTSSSSIAQIRSIGKSLPSTSNQSAAQGRIHSLSKLLSVSSSYTIARDIQQQLVRSLIASSSSSLLSTKIINKMLDRSTSSSVILTAGKDFLRDLFSASSSSPTLYKQVEIIRAVVSEHIVVRAVQLLRTLDISSTSSSALLRSIPKLLEESSSSSVNIVGVGHFMRELLSSSSSSLDVVKGMEAHLDVVSDHSVARILQLLRAIDTSSSSTLVFLKSFAKLLEGSSSSSASISILNSFLRSVLASSSSSPALYRGMATFLYVSSSSVSGMDVSRAFLQLVDAASTHNVIVQRGVGKSLTVTADSTSAALTKLMAYSRSLIPSTSGSQASHTKQVSKFLTQSSLSDIVLRKGVGLTLRFLSIGTQRTADPLVPSEEQDPDEDVAPSDGEDIYSALLFKSIGKLLSSSSSHTLLRTNRVGIPRLVSSSSSLSLTKGFFKTITTSSSSLYGFIAEYIERTGGIYPINVAALSSHISTLGKSVELARTVSSSSAVNLGRIHSLSVALIVSSSSLVNFNRDVSFHLALVVSSFQVATKEIIVPVIRSVTTSSQVSVDGDTLRGKIITVSSSSAATIRKHFPRLISILSASSPEVERSLDIVAQHYELSIAVLSTSSTALSREVVKLLLHSSTSLPRVSRGLNQLVEASSSSRALVMVDGAVRMVLAVTSANNSLVLKGKELIFVVTSPQTASFGRTWVGAKKFLSLIKKVGV